MALNREQLLASLRQTRNPAIQQLQQLGNTSRGLDTRTGLRNIAAPQSSSASNANTINSLEANAARQTENDKDFWNNVLDRTIRTQQEAADYMIGAGKEATQIHHNNQMQINDQNNLHNRDIQRMTMQDNESNRSFDYLKNNENNETKRYTTDAEADVRRYEANLNSNSILGKANIDKEATLGAAQIQAEVSRNNALLGAYSNMYSNYLSPRSEYRYW